METQTNRKILVATDFSAGSDEAFERAIVLAGQSGAALELVHVISLGEEPPFDVGPFGSNYIAAVERTLERQARHATERGLRCEPVVLEGNPAAEIAYRARAIGAEYIVMGTHGRTGLAHALLGSTAERVLRRASCPVVTVPFSKKAAAA